MKDSKKKNLTIAAKLFPLEKCNGSAHFPLEKCKTSLYKGKFYDFFLPGQLVWKRRIVIAYEEREGEG